MRSPVGAFTLALLLLAARAGAQQYDLRTFSLEQGVPSASINAICKDNDGFLWVATEAGLARSQGSRFEAYDERQGAPAAEATALLPTTTAAGLGQLWTGYRNGALATWSKGRFTPFNTNQQLPKYSVRSLLSGQGNTLWLGSRGGGVWQVDTTARTATAMNAGLPSLRINALALHGNVLLAATDSGLFRLNDQRWTAVEADGAWKGKRILSLHCDSHGVVVGTNQGYLELDHALQPLPLLARVACTKRNQNEYNSGITYSDGFQQKRMRQLRHAELLLQVGGAGSILEAQFLFGIDDAERLLRHQRALVEARENKLQLAGVAVNVANRENTGVSRFQTSQYPRE